MQSYFNKFQFDVETPLFMSLLQPFSNSELCDEVLLFYPPLSQRGGWKSRKSDVLSCLSSQLAVRKTTNQQRVTSMSELDRLHRSQVYPPARGLYSLRVIAFISSQK
ncbi:hypothetical protein TNIN_204591 [Trichonephila inaurata madagascariensis]|uniref:Uncharacterized protein n=1 Tax=Trichonephila inaurata madagascariensis TaxID=2747483 RepID=A0A8X7CFX0_9ARAC|nr:hypothetical protein TNIN_204591 [Trichonephila inaurata madagascariensis]